MEGDLVKQERILKSLANRRRLMIVVFLKKKKKASVGKIAEEIKLSFKSTSKHLAILASAEVVLAVQKDLYRYYRISPKIPALARKIVSIL